MSIALHRNRGVEIEPSVVRPSILDPPEPDRTSDDSEEAPAPASSESSSIGKNSDVSSGGDDCEDNEVQSSYKGPLEMMDALEEVLPIRKGISTFYEGKSRSYTSLIDASSSSTVKEIAKPENAYSRRRRNLLAFHQIWEKNHHSSSLKGNLGGISKRPLSSSKSTLALAVAMSNSESYSSTTSEDSSSSSICNLPPLHPQPRKSITHMMPSSSSSPRRNLSQWRSYSVADLQSHGPVGVRFDDPIDENAEIEENNNCQILH